VLLVPLPTYYSHPERKSGTKIGKEYYVPML
jgi:hypothetical protein